MVILETVYSFKKPCLCQCLYDFGPREANTQIILQPLYFLDHVQTAVHDKLIHVPCFVAEARHAISAGLVSTELVLEERIVFRADYCKVVRHISGMTTDGENGPRWGTQWKWEVMMGQRGRGLAAADGECLSGAYHGLQDHPRKSNATFDLPLYFFVT